MLLWMPDEALMQCFTMLYNLLSRPLLSVKSRCSIIRNQIYLVWLYRPESCMSTGHSDHFCLRSRTGPSWASRIYLLQVWLEHAHAYSLASIVQLCKVVISRSSAAERLISAICIGYFMTFFFRKYSSQLSVLSRTISAPPDDSLQLKHQMQDTQTASSTDLNDYKMEVLLLVRIMDRKI